MFKAFACAFALLGIVSAAQADLYITEYMYSGNGAEFVEFTNVGGPAIDMTGWSYDDSSQAPGTLDLSAFGVVAPGESVIITEDFEATFRTDWSLDPAVKVIGEYTNNLGRNDQINLYNAADMLVDVLTYGDEDFPGSIRAKDFSGNPITPGAFGADDIYQWVLSASGDQYGSYLSANGDVGNPGINVPEPASLMLLVLGAGCVLRRR